MFNRFRTPSLLCVVLSLCVMLSLCASMVACGSSPDPKFVTTQATLNTLFNSYGVAQMGEEAVQKQLRESGRFNLNKPDDFRECFADFKRPEDEGAAGFVFGRLAPRKDSLRVEAKKDRANIYFRGDEKKEPIAVMVRENEGWKLSLKHSVPADIRVRLRELYLRAEKQRSGG